MRRLVVVLMAALCSGLASRAQAAKGTDAYGYRWYDSLEPECPHTDATTGSPNIVVLTDDQVVGPFPIGFAFNLYGRLLTDFWISSNGWIALGTFPPPDSRPSPGTLPSTGLPNSMIAPFWIDLQSVTAIHGLDPTGSYYFVRWLGTIPGNPHTQSPEVRLYPSGQIMFVFASTFRYLTLPEYTKFVSGIENDVGNFGMMTWNRGVGLDTYQFRPQTAVCLMPPPRLTCSSTVGCNAIRAGDTTGRASRVTGYGCDPAVLDGGEIGHRLTLTSATEVSAALTGIGGRDMRLFLTSGCDENSCIDGGEVVIGNRLLGPGSYSLVVDSPLGSEGAFTVETNCLQRGFPVTCPTTRGDAIGTGPSLFDSYPCSPDAGYLGPENFYDVTLAAGSNLRVDLTATCDLDAFVLPASDLNAAACLAHGRAGARLFDAPAGNYVVVVEGRSGASCPYTISIDCGVELGCGAPLGLLNCGDLVAGSTVAASNDVDDYSCGERVRYDGGDVVYQLTAPVGQSVGVRLENPSTPDLAVFMLDGCNEGRCLDTGSAGAACDPTTVAGGSTFVVVDGKNGASGTFDLRVMCGPATAAGNDWQVCEGASAPTTIDTTVADAWHFFTPLPTPIEPNPIPRGSFCGTGCDFALFVPVDCGRELHVVLNDLESAAGIELTEVFTGRKGLLAGTNNGGKSGTKPWSYLGYEANWLSNPCVQPVPPEPPAPVDRGSVDPHFNDAVIDLALTAGENPCGLWRLDIRSAGGVTWDLFASCTGAAVSGYALYDNICDAAAAYAPRAELEVSSLATDGGCPVANLSFELTNLGCATVDAPWRLDAGPGSIVDGVELGLVAGESRTIARVVDVTAATGKVWALADADAAVTECSEALGSACSVAGVHRIELQACAGCGAPSPPTGEIGNHVRAVRAGVAADLTWAGAPVLGSVGGTHFHVYRSDRKRTGTWTNLPTPDLLAATAWLDAAPVAPMSLYQVRFANDCEDISGDPLP